METEFLIGNRMLSFVSSLELTLPVFFPNSITNRNKCSREFAVVLYIGTVVCNICQKFILFPFLFGKMAHASPELISVYSMNQLNSSPDNDNFNAPQIVGFVQLGARRNHAQKMETKFLIVNRMLFVSSLELTLPVFFISVLCREEMTVFS